MYHERSTKQRRRRRGMRLAALALVLALAVGGWFAADVVANVAMLFGAKVYADKMILV